MKILYGVQGTGNGHITRANAMAKIFNTCSDIQVDYLFSGRSHKSDYFDMDAFGNFTTRQGMTFIIDKGKVLLWETMKHNNLLRFIKDVRNMDLTSYDLVINDYEPITAWAAKLAKKPIISLGHQYAFFYDIPMKGDNLITRTVMKNFAPASFIKFGLHWHHFDQPILPPILDMSHSHNSQDNIIANKVLIYLNFDDPDVIIEHIKPIHHYEFYFYNRHFKQPTDDNHIHLRPLSRVGFQKDLANTQYILANSGFELTSEALHMGKHILVKPLKGQMEQLSNSLALEQLKLGQTTKQLNTDIIQSWLDNPVKSHVVYPDVARALVDWIKAKDYSHPNQLVDTLWQQTQINTAN